jgi:hypothetical protein
LTRANLTPHHRPHRTAKGKSIRPLCQASAGTGVSRINRDRTRVTPRVLPNCPLWDQAPPAATRRLRRPLGSRLCLRPGAAGGAQPATQVTALSFSPSVGIAFHLVLPACPQMPGRDPPRRPRDEPAPAPNSPVAGTRRQAASARRPPGHGAGPPAEVPTKHIDEPIAREPALWRVRQLSSRVGRDQLTLGTDDAIAQSAP